MASTLRFLCIPTARATNKCSRPNDAACRRSIILGRSVNRRKQTCRATVEAWKSWRIGCKDDGVFESQPSSDYSAASMELVAEFYRLINQKDTIGLLELISDECFYDDRVFYLPFQGKEQIGNFLHELMDAMGPHVEFVVENVTNGRKNSASVIWHLEWQGKKIPFATGYNYFEFHEIGKRLLIWKIRGLEELPVKPGDLVLKLLKTATTLFDHYPSATEGLLSAPHSMNDVVSVILHLFSDTLDQSDPFKRR